MDTWLESAPGRLLAAEFSHDEVVEVMRWHLAEIRGRLTNGGGAVPDLMSDEYADRLRDELVARRAISLKPVINATGIVIHTNLGRSPLAPEAIEAMTEVARGYSNLELDLEAGVRGSRNSHVASLLCELTGAEAALVVNNCAAAVLLALRALAGDGDVVVSRGELIEIGGSFRMPDVIAESGARMTEVGTTNRTTLRDYADAVSETTRVLLTSHPSNYRIIGFTAKPEPGELAALAKQQGLSLVQDLGSGSLVKLPELGLDEPTVAECIAAGADVVTFSGDKLLGGPQAGIIVGRRELIERLRSNPMARAMRIDKLSLAGLTATLKLYQAPNDPLRRVPVLDMITLKRQTLARRAGRLARELDALPGVSATVADGAGYAGGGALPMTELAGRVVRIEAGGLGATELAARLRLGSRPVVARIAKDAVTIDLRTVKRSEVRHLVQRVREATA